jgi:hypothetical protein
MNHETSLGSVALSPEHAAAEAAGDRLLQKAATDKAFRSRLRANPVETMRQEGIAVPDGVRVTFLELDLKHAYLFLPPLQVTA